MARKKPAPAKKSPRRGRTKKPAAPGTPHVAAVPDPPARPAPPPLPTTTFGPDYDVWLDHVCTQGGGFVAPAGTSQAPGQVPTIQARAVNLIDRQRDGKTETLHIEMVDGFGVGATTREEMEEQRRVVRLVQGQERERLRAAISPLLGQPGAAGTPTATPAPAQTDAAGAHDSGGDRVPSVSVDDTDLAILRVLGCDKNRGRRLNQAQISAQTKSYVSERTVNKRMRRLAAGGLVSQDEGKKGGYTITTLGLELLKRLSPPAPRPSPP